jgi:hypothetical protein
LVELTTIVMPYWHTSVALSPEMWLFFGYIH